MSSKLRGLLLFFAFIVVPQVLFAQSGKIAGRITDSKTGEGLPFVNVVIEGTKQGAATDVDGYYSILNVRPGTYTIKASAIGFSPSAVSNVRVSIDLTAKVDFKLSDATLQLSKEVVVVAERPLVTKDLTASTAIVGAEDIAALPVTEFQDVLKLKAGMVGGKVRGGRAGEVVYAIDGVPVTDVYDGSSVIDVNANSIQELQFVSGAFNAEYGKALSGYVNIATKDGDNKYAGQVLAYIGDNVSNHTDLFRAVDKVNPLAIRNLEGSFSGPIIADKLTFYTNLRYIYFDGWLKGERAFNPYNVIWKNPDYPANSSIQWIVNRDGDHKIISMNFNEKVNGQGKVTWKIIPTMKLSFNYLYERVQYRDYDYLMQLAPDGDFKRHRESNTNILGLTHTLGSNTFYQLNLSYIYKKYYHYAYESMTDPNYVNSVLMDDYYIYSFHTGGIKTQHFSRSTGMVGVKFDLTSQVTPIHQIKGGFEFNSHKLDYSDITPYQALDVADPRLVVGGGNPYVKLIVPDQNNPADYLRYDVYSRKPTEFSAYLQDKIELNEMIVNVGIRYDYFKSDGYILNDPTDPDIMLPRNPNNSDTAVSLSQRYTYWYKSPTVKHQFSPRLGVAFPITDKSVVHFSYGHFFQIPSFELLFTNPNYKMDHSTGLNGRIAGNPDLKPESTISGEVGLQTALSDDISMDLTGYFRDIRNLVGTSSAVIQMYGGTSTYAQYSNSDFGFVRGIIVSINKRLTNNWSASLDYTLQSAKGNATDPKTSFNQVQNGQLPEMQIIKLGQDQTHTLNITFNYESSDLWGFSFIAQYGSGFPYTPSQSMNISDLLTNAETKPGFFNVDFKAYKDFQLGSYKLGFFLRVFNLFDKENEYDVYSDSGRAGYTINIKNSIGARPDIINTVQDYYKRPDWYSEPRRVEFGAKFSF